MAPELTVSTALSSWQIDPLTTVVIGAITVGYLLAARASGIGAVSRVLFVAGCGVWWYASNGFIAVYSDTLFWVRGLDYVLLALVSAFLLAVGRPVSVIASHRPALRRLLRLARNRAVRAALSPLPTSAAMLALPWLLFLTPWYPAVLESAAGDAVTRIIIVAVGAVYFYTRLQIDPVPRHRHSALSLLIATAETLCDGVLGVVLWQGGVIGAVAEQAGLRDWGPSARLDQTIGAGVIWILGDVLGLPFLMLLFTRLRADDDRTDVAAPAAVDPDDPDVDGTPAADPGRPWFLDDPQLADRFRR
ncbi:cytochrome c oxidase assembly protein [Gordonia shandongensis]|uniref:cytochrome c oxidase assembly protein n=1 Tax=Gordonia shandongensis TaxID=376351 RepID=UPI00041441A4|nr:cytochrome c oxidase assembly protein [Gordonia shandongensis]